MVVLKPTIFYHSVRTIDESAARVQDLEHAANYESSEQTCPEFEENFILPN